jgi:4-hydroxy-3-polyprenylbenzoate decarboxylase
MAYSDLRDFIRKLDKERELKRIRIEVDPVLEIAEFADRAVKSGGPALLFEHPKGYSIPVLINCAAFRNILKCACRKGSSAN